MPCYTSHTHLCTPHTPTLPSCLHHIFPYFTISHTPTLLSYIPATPHFALSPFLYICLDSPTPVAPSVTPFVPARELSWPLLRPDQYQTYLRLCSLKYILVMQFFVVMLGGCSLPAMFKNAMNILECSRLLCSRAGAPSPRPPVCLSHSRVIV